jgi:hypothetical protein
MGPMEWTSTVVDHQAVPPSPPWAGQGWRGRSGSKGYRCRFCMGSSRSRCTTPRARARTNGVSGLDHDSSPPSFGPLGPVDAQVGRWAQGCDGSGPSFALLGMRKRPKGVLGASRAQRRP